MVEWFPCKEQVAGSIPVSGPISIKQSNIKGFTTARCREGKGIKMAWKMDDKGNFAVADGNPVWIDESGAESPADYKAATVKIATLNRENGEHRTKLKDANDRLSAFAGIDDPAEALKGMQFMASMDGKKVMDDEGIQKLIQAAVKPLQVENEALKTGLSEKDSHIYKLEVSSQFQASPFVKDKLLVPPDMLEATFGKHFKIDGGKMVATDATGNQIFNTKGEPAGFDDAIKVLIDAHPMKDNLYRASGQSGTGSQQSNGTGGTGVKVISRAVFATMNPAQQSAHALSGGQITD